MRAQASWLPELRLRHPYPMHRLHQWWPVPRQWRCRLFATTAFHAHLMPKAFQSLEWLSPAGLCRKLYHKRKFNFRVGGRAYSLV